MEPLTKAASVAKPVRWIRPTNFYPLYDEANDQVDRVSSIRAVAFQRVLPRYRLSTSETRDQGTGPGIEEIPVFQTSQTFKFYPTKLQSSGELPADSGKIIDLFA